ncbi:hypothetical protein F5J12DRAFT_905256 [Pisolithus orientalis]|uniref:uncharacterized protein n=1 Tax=Pisolithus orientalis TaxID=936130 RepID=UPI00222554F4|nr:uncharacterized protein F5J12DRAFT_905256 [Pisolithus orientalis]KAI6008149.1 hypothetical protein F5J12DRAFT_905256 [Pisolithus orientalis]
MPLSAQTRAKLQQFWKMGKYLILHEMSMLGKTFLTQLSWNIDIGKMVVGQCASDHLFGGISVIMCGDFHQFPPIAVGPTEALYFPTTMQCDCTLPNFGCAIYEEFQKVVVHQEQIQVTDAIWHDFLQCLCYGQVQAHHIEMLCSLVLTNPRCMPTNFSSAPWTDACLATPCHDVKWLWDEIAVLNHAQKKQICIHYELPDDVDMSVGMKVMVTKNVQTDLDITNGACGTIHFSQPPLETY